MLPRIIGHRGARRERPENTLGSLRRAIDLGVEGVEVDIRVSRDGVPVLFHDPDLRRLLGRPQWTEDLTAAELKRLVLPEPPGTMGEGPAAVDAPSVFGRGDAGGRIALLSEALEELGDWDGLRLLELKSPTRDRADLVGAVAHVLSERPAANRILISFDFELIEEVARLRPRERRGVILSGRPSAADWRKAVGLGTEAVVLRDRLVTPERIDWLWETGRSVYVYPINDLAAVNRLARSTVAGLITDDPRALRGGEPFARARRQGDDRGRPQQVLHE